MTEIPQFPGAPDLDDTFVDTSADTTWRRRAGRIAGQLRPWLRGPRRAAKVAGLFSALLLLGFAIVDRGIVHRFEQRRSALPSRTYSLPFELQRRDHVRAADLLDRLNQLGYREVAGQPARAGEFRRSRDIWTVYLRPDVTTADREGRLVELRFRRSGLRRITDLETRTALDRIALDPVPLFTYYAEHMEERRWTSLDRVPQEFVDALEVVEDRRFRRHFGVDLLGVGRAMLANVGQGQIVQGGSTITQQLAKNLYHARRRTWGAKLREAVAAVALELHYDKDEILEAYVNEVYLGQDGPVAISGIGDASLWFFGVPAAELDLARSALLVGMIRNPGGNNPRTHPDRALERRDLVLELMHEQGRIDEERLRIATARPLDIVPPPADNERLPWAAAYLAEAFALRGEGTPLSRAGYSLYTTFDPAIQRAAGAALRRGLERIERYLGSSDDEEPLEGAVVVLRPSDGAILALVGGRDYARSQFNRATQAQRPAGSALKPFVYLAALERAQQEEGFEFTLATVLDDSPLELVSGARTWSPANYDREFRGPVTARRALEMSLNVPAVRVAMIAGLDRVVETIERAGIEGELQPVPSLALGATEVTPLELASAFATLANGGSLVRPHGLVALRDRDGTLQDLAPVAPQPVVDERLTYILNDVLQGVFERGTARTAEDWGFHGTAAGKTGSSDDLRDAWFVGYTPDILVAVWVGYDDNRPIGLPGAGAALPIWVDVMKRIGADKFHEFRRPRGLSTRWIDPLSGQRAHTNCPEAVRELFVSGTATDEVCTLHPTRRRFSWPWTRRSDPPRSKREPV